MRSAATVARSAHRTAGARRDGRRLGYVALHVPLVRWLSVNESPNVGAGCAHGYRPIQVWVPDVRNPEFAREAHCQSVRLAGADRIQDDQNFVEAISVGPDDEE